MSKMEAVAFWFLLALVSALFHHHTEAGPTAEIERVLLAYNTSSDRCKEITELSDHESRKAAGAACKQAFQALDESRLNTCHGWRLAACRPITGSDHYQCTCVIANREDPAVKNSQSQSHIVRAIRECAPRLAANQQTTGHKLAPFPNFQQYRSQHDEHWQAKRLRNTGSYTGYSSSGVFYPSGGAGSSSSPQTVGGAGISWRPYTSSYGYPIEEYPSFAAGTSSRKSPEPVGSSAPPRPYVCNECGAAFRTMRRLFDHKRAYHSVFDTYCEKCNFTYSTKKIYRAHLRKKHRELYALEKATENLPEQSAEAEALFPFACNICPRRYSSRHGLRVHVKSHISDETKCPVCPKSFSTRGNMKHHVESVHPGTPIPEPAPRGSARDIGELEIGPFICGECGKQFTHKKGLRGHEKSHKSLETYCGDCDMTFSAPQSYKHHMQVQHPVVAAAEKAAAKARRDAANQMQCPDCPKRFKNDRGLQDHKAFHDGKSKCDECNKVLPRRSALLSHKRKEHPK